jgi:NADH dehydrogenase
MGDVMLTADEIRGLAADLLISHEPPTGSTRLSDWLTRNVALVGAHYASELAKRT